MNSDLIPGDMRIFLFLLSFMFSFTSLMANGEVPQSVVKNTATEAIKKYTNEEALAISQSAIGNTLGQYRFTLPSGKLISSKEFLGKPLIISLIYTSCYHICPTTTENLNRVVQKAKQVLGDDSFNVITLGFDTEVDKPEAMKYFAKMHATDSDNWFFLSMDTATMKALVRDTGFIYSPSPQGFDHLIQATIIDKNSRVYRQVYGITPKTPHFVEPLKELVFGESKGASMFDAITSKVKLFCTVYDPAQDKYYFNYSIFVGLFVGIVMGTIFLRIFFREWRYTKKMNR